MTIYELHGRLIESQQDLLAEYSRLLSLIRRIKDGDLDASTVEIDDAALRWTIVPRVEDDEAIGKRMANGQCVT